MNLSKKLLIGFLTLTLTVASAASEFKLDLSQSVQVGATEVKPGKYKVELQGDKVVFMSGKEVVAQAPATEETANQKYSFTAVSTQGSKLLTISIGGTNKRIVLKP